MLHSFISEESRLALCIKFCVGREACVQQIEQRLFCFRHQLKTNAMAEKNPSSNGNIDHNKHAVEDWENHHDTGDRYPDDAKGIGETEVKNAHAAGDGALEKYDTNLEEKNDTGLFNNDLRDEKERGRIDPPY